MNNVESFNSEEIALFISDFEDKCSSILNELRLIDTEVNETVQNIGSATIFGDVGNKLLQVWENNCSDFQNYDFLFQNWVVTLKTITKNTSNLVSVAKSFYSQSDDNESSSTFKRGATTSITDMKNRKRITKSAKKFFEE